MINPSNYRAYRLKGLRFNNFTIFFLNSRVDGATVSKLLAEKWRALDQTEKQKFYVEAERLKNLHQLQHPNYKYAPKPRRIGMKQSVTLASPMPKISNSISNASNISESQEFTINIPDSASEDISVHNVTNDQNIIIQPVTASTASEMQPQQPQPQIIPIPEADQTFTTSIVDLSSP